MRVIEPEIKYHHYLTVDGGRVEVFVYTTGVVRVNWFENAHTSAYYKTSKVFNGDTASFDEMVSEETQARFKNGRGSF